MHLNEFPFLTTVSRDIHCGAALVVDNLTCSVLEEGLKNMVRGHKLRGFNVVVIMLDKQFKSIKDRSRVGVPINLVSRGEHALVIERFHRVIQERCRCYYAMVPFDYLPRQMVVHLMKIVIFM